MDTDLERSSLFNDLLEYEKIRIADDFQPEAYGSLGPAFRKTDDLDEGAGAGREKYFKESDKRSKKREKVRRYLLSESFNTN